MDLQRLHNWQLSPKEAIALQRKLAARIRLEPLGKREIRLIAGVDVSCMRGDPTLTAGVVVWDKTTGMVVDTSSAQAAETFPYVPGLLSFREIPILEAAVRGLSTVPDCWFVDGQGIAHPRRLGIAAHLGLLLDMPTIGVAKSRLCGEFDEPGPLPGDRSPITDRGEHIGYALRTKAGSNPLIISPGHRVGLEEVCELVLACCRGYRLPEPTRLAHQYVNEVRRGEVAMF